MDKWTIVTIYEAKKAKRDLLDKEETREILRALKDRTLIIDEEGIVRVPTLPDKISQFLPDIPQIGKLIGELKEIGRIFEVSESKVSKESLESYELKDLKLVVKQPTQEEKEEPFVLTIE